jgi:hypothetical protein
MFDTPWLLVHASNDPLVFALAGALFSFGKKAAPVAANKEALETINHAVTAFLQSRGVVNFKVYTLEYSNRPVVLIKAEAQKKLRFSNILEVQIRKFLHDKLSVEVPAVFWRFKMDYSDEPGPEQSDYDYEDRSPPGTSQPTSAQADQAESTEPAEAPETEELVEEDDLYDVHHSTRHGLSVEEIPMGEFDEFLKETTILEAPEKEPSGDAPK